MRGSWLLAFAALACSEKVYDDPPNGRLPGDQAGYREGREGAVDAARIAAKAGCKRLWNDCSSLCDEIFVYCGNSQDHCVEDYALGAVEDLLYPVYSEELAEQCADQLSQRSCIDLDPNSSECDAVVLEGCPNDEDGYGLPYSWLAAHELETLPTTLSPHLCENTDEWFVFSLEAGERVTVTPVSGSGYVWLSLYLPVNGAGKRDVTEVGSSLNIDPNSTDFGTQMFDPVPGAGIYYLKVDLGRAPFADYQLAIGTDRRAPPSDVDLALDTERMVYRALCQRLHGDCSANCSEIDFYCGSSIDECADAYARSALELFFDDPHPLDRNLAATCASELSTRACGDLGATSCGELFISHCATDPLAYGRPWAGRMAANLNMPAVLDLDLCDDVRQFYRFDLQAGDRLVMRTQVDPIDSVYGQLYPPSATDEDLLNSDNYLFWSFYLTSSETITDPVPFTGTYFYEVEYNASGPVRLMLRPL